MILHQQGYSVSAIYSPLERVSANSSAFSVTSYRRLQKRTARPSICRKREHELVAGFHTEYSSFKFAMFFMAEYGNMITVSCLATILFFGGWLSPLSRQLDVATIYSRRRDYFCAALYLAYDTVRNMRGIGRIQLTVVTLIAAVSVCSACARRGAGRCRDHSGFSLRCSVIFFYVWTRSTLPRFRYDQLMSFGWKLLLPVSLLNLVVTALWIVVKNP